MVNLPTIANRYQLQREIGRGGAGVVYAVKHLHTGEKLAMKVLLSHAANQPDLVQRFRREMQASALVRSEHVVRITDADLAPELQGVPFLVMELLSGADLGRLVVERYRPGFAADSRVPGGAMSTCVTGALIGLLVADGRLRHALRKEKTNG